MKIKNVRLDIQSEDEFIAETKDAMKGVYKGKDVKPQSVISFESMRTMKKFIKDEQIKILRAIKKNKPESIYEITKLLKRDTKNVSIVLLIPFFSSIIHLLKL